MFRRNNRHLLPLLAMLACAPAFAQAPQDADLSAVQQEIELSKDRQKQLAGQAKAAAEEQDTLANRLVALAETGASQERDLATVEERQTKLQGEIASLNLDLAAKQDVIAELLAGLQRLERNPPPALLVAPGDVLNALRGAMLFGTIVPELRGAAEKLHTQLQTLKDLRANLDQQKHEHAEALASLKQSRHDMALLIEQKKALALSSVQELAQEQQRAETLAAKAESLKQLLAALAEEKASAEASQSAETKARAAAEAELLARQAAPSMAFAKAQGQIAYPAQGRLIRLYGEESGLGGTLDGIVIATAKQAQVTSPAAGKVEFAGKFRSYGQMVIINPGDGYLVLLAGLEQTHASIGQSVKAGEPVGLMGNKPGQMALSNGLTNLTTPVLYVEFRHNGDPVDSAPWWIGHRQEAMR
jgi:murein hydrolase activator